MKKFIMILLVLGLALPVFAELIYAQMQTNKSDVYENFIFRLKLCQLSRYGAKIVYYSYTGYPRVIYAPLKFINDNVFIKVDPNIPYSFVHVVTINKKVERVIVFLPNIMVAEYSTADLSKDDEAKMQSVTELTFSF